MAKKLWGGRFKKETDAAFERFSASLVWDKRLLPYDLQIDIVHVKALKRCGVLNARESAQLLSAIRKLQKRYEHGTLRINEHAEDVHSALQELLRKDAGEVADKLHTARSRNDLVAQSARLYCLDHSGRILHLLRHLKLAIVGQAEKSQEILVPGMTHLQNAQVLSLAHVFLAYVEMLDRAAMRMEGARPFFDVCVLGSGALAGVTFSLDQKEMARDLGLSNVTRNSYDVSGDRDFALNYLSSIAFVGLQLSRVAEDLMIGQLRGTGIIDIDESLCTGSSMMPQKKNADFVELLRGVSGVFAGNFIGMAMILKGLPTSYNRDLQWDKKYIFDSTETCETVLSILTKLFKTLHIRESRAKALLKDESLYATDYADYLVQRGVSFKEAHAEVGRIVQFSETNGVSISKIGLDLLKRFAPKTEGDVYSLFDPQNSVRMKRTQGSTHPGEIKKQIRYWKAFLRKDHASFRV